MIHALLFRLLDWPEIRRDRLLRLWPVIGAVACTGMAHAQALPPIALPQASDLHFQDFYRAPIGPAGLEISETLRESDGKAVRLVGYMVQQDKTVPGRFMLAPRPVQMSEHADGEADDLPPATVLVNLAPEQQSWLVPHMRGLVAVSGVLLVGRHEDPGGRVSWVRLQLEPQAARTMGPVEMSVFLHSRLHPH